MWSIAVFINFKALLINWFMKNVINKIRWWQNNIVHHHLDELELNLKYIFISFVSDLSFHLYKNIENVYVIKKI